MSESARIAFLEQRDGKDGALEFAKRTIHIYRKAVLTSRKKGFGKPNHASLPEYRRSFIESYKFLKGYVG